MNMNVIDELTQRFAAGLPAGAAALRKDLENNFKAVLQAALARMDLVSRREFDIQAGVLQRTRERLESLEARLSVLENSPRPPPEGRD